jgi:hypothetical protein
MLQFDPIFVSICRLFGLSSSFLVHNGAFSSVLHCIYCILCIYLAQHFIPTMIEFCLNVKDQSMGRVCD